MRPCGDAPFLAMGYQGRSYRSDESLRRLLLDRSRRRSSERGERKGVLPHGVPETAAGNVRREERGPVSDGEKARPERATPFRGAATG